MRLRRFQDAVRRRFIDDFGQILRHRLERLIDRQSEMAGKILHLRVAEHRFQLLLGDWQIRARTEPGFDLSVEAAILRRGHEPVEIVIGSSPAPR